MKAQKFYWNTWLSNRKYGRPKRLGFRDKQYEKLYSSMQPLPYWDPAKSGISDYGGVFNLEFSPDGAVLVAATEKRSILVFDPLSQRKINFVDTGHSDCVNCARFLDSRTFATCSDDTTVALWDVRYLKNKIRTLKGHSNWVKNIEYSDKTGLLVTSGFDGSIYTWDINRYTDGDTPYTRAFHTSGLMRTKLTPDSSKLIMSTTGGYMMIIHDLNLHTLASDLKGFKPNTYRIVQLGDGSIRLRNSHNHLFTAKRNRIELISDFPRGNDAEMIASLQVHPEGWSVLSRNTSSDENSEWTCVHDIQEYDASIEEEEEAAKPKDDTNDDQSQPARTVPQPVVQISMHCLNENPPASSASQGSQNPPPAPSQPSSSLRFGNVRFRISHRQIPELDQDSDIVVQADSLSRVDFYSRLLFPDSNRPAIFIHGSDDTVPRTVIFVRPPGAASEPSTSHEPMPPEQRKSAQVPKNRKRLTHFIEEPNVGRGFIKELCFSPDGRVISSPFGFGVRLLAFDPKFSELCDCVPQSPVQLHESQTNIMHSDIVVSTKFSPTHNLLVCGCLGGKLSFHQPVL